MTDQELEKLLAEKCMGWRKENITETAPNWYLYWHEDYWHPLQDADQMFMVVDKVCTEKHLWLKLHGPWDPQSPVREPGMLNWFAGFTTQGATGFNGRGDYEADAPHMLHAIALALCKIVEVEP